MTDFSPRALATSVSPIPVLPAVPSTTAPPGSTSPRSRASRIIHDAGRSFTEKPGLRNSHLPKISQPVISEAFLSRIRGVSPISPSTSRDFISVPPRRHRFAAW